MHEGCGGGKAQSGKHLRPLETAGAAPKSLVLPEPYADSIVLSAPMDDLGKKFRFPAI
jgi:hypothetical protein